MSPPEFPPLRANALRDAWCGQIADDAVDGDARVAGWVHRRRDHGGLVFIDLRDRTGLLQLVFNPDLAGAAFDLGHKLRSEDVISVTGKIVNRSAETVNAEMATGAFELMVADAGLLADADTPPFEIESFSGEVGEELRLKHRYLDLRRQPMQDAIARRAAVMRSMRSFFDGEGFLEIETPMLARSTPEGARDFLVPARREAGAFYALPQSPQLFKQLLMVAGFERYFQIVRCFRDEDQRADRQPDFTQLDVEMSFVEVEDVLDVNERMIAHVFAEVDGPQIELPIQRLGYNEALDRFGTDRPDLRFGVELVDLSDALRQTEFKVFRGVLDSGGAVKGINVGSREMPRSALDALIGRAQELGAKGLVWAFREGAGWRSPTAKFLTDDELGTLNGLLGAEDGDLLLVVADTKATANAVLGQLRLDMGRRFDLIDDDQNSFCWIVDWPLFEWNEGEDRWDPLHHPFTAPDGDLDPDDPGAVRAKAYDIVWNGQELGGGSIRISDPDLQARALAVIGIDAAEAEARFGFLLDALRYGAPPHGGIAYGLDRFVQRLVGAESIRDVIAFPKAASGMDPLTGAPAPVDEAQLRELGLQLRLKPSG